MCAAEEEVGPDGRHLGDIGEEFEGADVEEDDGEDGEEEGGDEEGGEEGDVEGGEFGVGEEDLPLDFSEAEGAGEELRSTLGAARRGRPRDVIVGGIGLHVRRLVEAGGLRLTAFEEHAYQEANAGGDGDGFVGVVADVAEDLGVDVADAFFGGVGPISGVFFEVGGAVSGEATGFGSEVDDGFFGGDGFLFEDFAVGGGREIGTDSFRHDLLLQ